ncbi:MAG: hypothetical protein US50_C0070G0003 [Candidatus Nomurabacteria bacterium GW2011_GWB1_37_5]|uniref:AB hydrolase-1 domain-containing protein n=1 Tax=Candidatus Nomurabacteria bacterium GW2011_GWB1_37_5 TaxID=1618742 RepID=A0A0G0H5N0_9BACT|nr:MAG: hypothetical protein US50_C0070G0003 [Candidatus Nomurabacteria bacterium GW2011_GWB1_37_5]
MKQNYKTILYELSQKRNSQKLIIILPRAAAKFEKHKELIVLLNQLGTVLFLESGYFGISKAGQNLEDLDMDHFRDSLHELVNKLGYKKVVLIGESVGAIHALNYASCYQDEVVSVVLSNPALYKRRWLSELLFVPILNLGIKTSPDTLLKVLGKLLKLLPKNGPKRLGDTFIGMIQAVGAISYLACLREIVDFNHKYENENFKSVLSKTFILKGKNDQVFDLLCNDKYCKSSLRYIEIPSAGHGIIDTNPHQVIRLLSREIIDA